MAAPVKPPRRQFNCAGCGRRVQAPRRWPDPDPNDVCVACGGSSPAEAIADQREYGDA